MNFLVILAFFLLATQTATAESSHQHDHHQSDSLKLELNQGKKWATDSSLRSNMSKIHDHIKINLGKIHSNKMNNSEYTQLGKKIKTNINLIFKNCKLRPKADAQLHIVMARLMSANNQLIESGDTKEQKKAVHQILESYQAYLKYFNHNSAGH